MSNISLTVSQAEAKMLLQFYEIELGKIELRRAELLRVIDQLKAQQSVSDKNQLSFVETSKPVEEYQASWSWPLKARYALRKANRCLSVREIFNIICDAEPSLKANQEYERTQYQYLASAISTRVRDQKIFDRYQPFEGSDYQIGLKEWFEVRGVVRPEHRSTLG